MARRTLTVESDRWEVYPSGRVTVYGRDQFGLIFEHGTGPQRRRRVTHFSPLGARSPERAFAELSERLPHEHEGLQTFLRDTRAARRLRGEQIIAKLQGLGVAIDLDDVEAQLLGGDGGALGRPHVARALVDCGACDTVTDAFRRYLGRGRAAYVEKPLPKLGEVTTLVHEVGGLTSAAHLGDHGSEAQIRIFQDQGLDCVEVRHPSHPPAVEQRLTRIAQRLGLGISGGSDWHGESEYGESHAPLGGMRVPDTWLEPLEHRLELTTRKRDERAAADRQ